MTCITTRHPTCATWTTSLEICIVSSLVGPSNKAWRLMIDREMNLVGTLTTQLKEIEPGLLALVDAIAELDW